MENGIIIYTQQYPSPENVSVGVFTHQLVSSLKAVGNRVVVIVPEATYPHHYLLNFLKGTTVRYIVYGVAEIDCYHVKFLHIPYIFRIIQPLMQYLCLKKSISNIIAVNNIRLINAHFVFPDGYAAYLLSNSFKLKLVITALGSDINVFAKKKLYKPLIQRVLLKSDQVTGKSKQLINEMVKITGWRRKYTAINNGVDKKVFFFNAHQRVKFRKELDISKNQILFLFTGRLHQIKNIDILILAFHRLTIKSPRKYLLYIVGDGDQGSHLSALIIKCGLQKQVILTGNINHQNIPQYLSAADLFILPSQNEGQPNVILEALSCGLPVVATKVGGIPEMITEGINGYLAHPGDVKSLQQAIEKASTKKWSRSNISQQSGLESWSTVAEKYSRVFRELMPPI